VRVVVVGVVLVVGDGVVSVSVVGDGGDVEVGPGVVVAVSAAESSDVCAQASHNESKIGIRTSTTMLARPPSSAAPR
jgi:hypothetical protein